MFRIWNTKEENLYAFRIHQQKLLYTSKFWIIIFDLISYKTGNTYISKSDMHLISRRDKNVFSSIFYVLWSSRKKITENWNSIYMLFLSRKKKSFFHSDFDKQHWYASKCVRAKPYKLCMAYQETIYVKYKINTNNSICNNGHQSLSISFVNEVLFFFQHIDKIIFMSKIKVFAFFPRYILSLLSALALKFIDYWFRSTGLYVDVGGQSKGENDCHK